MNKTISTTLAVMAILVIAGVIFFAGAMYARANAFGLSMMGGYGWNHGNAYGPGMTLVPDASAGVNGRGPSMMGGNEVGPNVMGGYGYNNANLPKLSIDQAKSAAEKYLANFNNSDLQIAEIMIFDNNAYVAVKETSTGVGAFELRVDSVSQIAYPEHGPNMMWNLKYSGLNHQYMMGGYGGMMSGYSWESTTSDNVSAEMTVTSEQAIEYAQEYLDANIPGATAAADPIQFHGYYTIDFERDGKVAGMLSVNGFSGQVFLHTWHGMFVEESQFE